MKIVFPFGVFLFKIRLRDGKAREIQHMMATSFWSVDGRPISAEEFLNNLFGELPKLFKDEEELRVQYQTLEDAKEILGDVANIRSLFIDFQQHLYLPKAA